MSRYNTKFVTFGKGGTRVQELKELYTRNSIKRNSGRPPPQVPKRNPETRLSSGSTESQDLDLSQFQYDDGNHGNNPVSQQQSQDYSPKHGHHGYPGDIPVFSNHHNGDHGHYGAPVGGGPPVPSLPSGGGLPPPLPPSRGSVGSMPGYALPGHYHGGHPGENGLGSVSPPPPPPGFDMGATMSSSSSQAEELYETRLPTHMDEVPAHLLQQQHSLSSSHSGGSEYDYYGGQIVPTHSGLDNGYPAPHELYETTLPRPQPTPAPPASVLRRSSSSSSGSQSHKSSPYTGSKETIMPPEYYGCGGTLPLQLAPQMTSPPPHHIHNQLHQQHHHHQPSPESDFPPPPPPQLFQSVPSAPSSMPGSPQRPPPPTLPKPHKQAGNGNVNSNRSPANGGPPPAPPLSSLPRNGNNGFHNQATPASYGAPPPPPPPPLGGLGNFNQHDSNQLAAQLQAVNLRNNIQSPPEDKLGKSPLVNAHTDLISQIHLGVALRKSPAGKKIRVGDETRVDDCGDTFSETASVTSSGSGEDYSGSSTSSRPPPPTLPKPNKPSPIHSNTMPSGGCVANHSNNSSVTSDEFDMSQVDGYQAVPDGCPDWKRAMLERKNQQLVDSAKKNKAEKDKEKEKWKGIPEWKKALIMDREKRKDDEQNPQEEEIRKRKDEEMKIQNMPEWKRVLYMKKKTDI